VGRLGRSCRPADRNIVRVVKGRGDRAGRSARSVPIFPDEAELRDAIADRPSLLFDGDERPVAVATEVPVPSIGSADVVAVDAAGQITIVECKLEKNPEIRRRGIGQVFAYAGWLWQLPYEEFEKRVAKGGAELRELVDDEPGWQTFRDTVSENLEAGRFQLIIAVDRIDKRLRRTIEFLCRHMGPEVGLLALELRVGEKGLEVVEVYGDEDPGPPRIRMRAPRARLLEAIRHRSGDEAAEAADQALKWAERKPQLKIDHAEQSASIRVKSSRGALFKIGQHREISVRLPDLAAKNGWDSELTEQYENELADIGVGLERGKRRVPLVTLAGEDKREEFQAVMERILETVIG
jgi:hypothetical protein